MSRDDDKGNRREDPDTNRNLPGARVEIPMRMKDGPRGKFFIGNCDLSVDVENAVIFFYPDKDGQGGRLVIERHRSNGGDRR